MAQFVPQKRSKVSPEVLAPEHYHILDRAIRNVLSTELAELTMAQLVDGLPLAASGWDARGTLLLRGHPLTEHETLCDGVLEQTRAFRESFHPTMLSFDSYVTQAYQDSSVGSAQFNMRLMELVALAIHQIAVQLVNLQPKLHAGDIDSVVSWKRAPGHYAALEGRRRILEEPVFEPRPTLFFHIDYMDYEQYPDGLADVAGYWAEDRIFGGIVLFDRGESGLECRDVYFHSGRKRTTFRIWRLLDSQLSDLVEFLTSEDALPSPPFPLLATDDNLHRYDPWDAIAQHHIFRDPWERKVPPTKPEETRDVRSTGDYPELATMFTVLQQIPPPSPDAYANFRHYQDRIHTFLCGDSLEREPEGRPNGDETGVMHDVSAEPDGETNSLYVKTPPRSPVLSLAGDEDGDGSLYVWTPRLPDTHSSPVMVEPDISPPQSPVDLAFEGAGGSQSDDQQPSPSTNEAEDVRGMKRKRANSLTGAEKVNLCEEEEGGHR